MGNWLNIQPQGNRITWVKLLWIHNNLRVDFIREKSIILSLLSTYDIEYPSCIVGEDDESSEHEAGASSKAWKSQLSHFYFGRKIIWSDFFVKVFGKYILIFNLWNKCCNVYSLFSKNILSLSKFWIFAIAYCTFEVYLLLILFDR